MQAAFFLQLAHVVLSEVRVCRTKIDPAHPSLTFPRLLLRHLLSPAPLCPLFKVVDM